MISKDMSQPQRNPLCGHLAPIHLPLCRLCLQQTIGPDLLNRAELVAARDKPILIQGETGTGKTLLAEYIHFISPRSGRLVQKRSCGDFPSTMASSVLFGAVAGAFTDARDRAGILEMVDRGSLILDDIDYMPLELQQSFLRFLDDGRYFRVGETQIERRSDVKIIATSNKNLDVLVSERKFLGDLQARLNRFTLRVPPLRERPQAILRIAGFFLDEAARQIGQSPGYWTLDPAAGDLLVRQRWSKNVRELESVVATLTVLVRPNGGRVAVEDVMAALRDVHGEPGAPLPTASSPERQDDLSERIYRALRESGGKVSQAAKRVGCSRTTVYKHIRLKGWTV